jgi:hypothetical protein
LKRTIFINNCSFRYWGCIRTQQFIKKETHRRTIIWRGSVSATSRPSPLASYRRRQVILGEGDTDEGSKKGNEWCLKRIIWIFICWRCHCRGLFAAAFLLFFVMSSVYSIFLVDISNRCIGWL